MASRNTIGERLYNYKEVAYELGVSPFEVWQHLKQRGVKVTSSMLFSEKQLIRLGLFQEEKTEVYYIYESKINNK